MGLFKKNPDPITDRSRELNAKIAALESKIKRLSLELQPGPKPRLRSTVYARGGAVPPQPETERPQPSEPVFEKVNPFKPPAEQPPASPDVSELGVRKYDLWSLWERIRNHFQAPPAANPKLVSYLAAGSIQGLRPLRYEKRVKRRRFLLLAALLLFILLCIFYALEHPHPH